MQQQQLSVQDFCSSFNLLNQVVANHPPPGNKLVWVITIWILWMLAVIVNYVVWVCTRWPYGLLSIPFFMMFSTLLFIWRHRLLRQRVGEKHSLI
jgi:hypothetical protein